MQSSISPASAASCGVSAWLNTGRTSVPGWAARRGSRYPCFISVIISSFCMIQSALCFAFSSNASVPLSRCSRLSSYIFRPYRFIRSTASSSLRQQSSARFPRDVRPLRHKIISVLSGITGSPALGTFKGRRLEPSASTSTTSAARRQVSTAAARVSLPVGSRRPHTTTPWVSTRARSFSPSVSHVRGRRGWGLMWVVVVTITVRPAARASRARA